MTDAAAAKLSFVMWMHVRTYTTGVMLHGNVRTSVYSNSARREDFVSWRRSQASPKLSPNMARSVLAQVNL